MLSEKSLTAEYKRLPILIKKALKNRDWREASDLMQIMETIEWVLSYGD